MIMSKTWQNVTWFWYWTNWCETMTVKDVTKDKRYWFHWDLQWTQESKHQAHTLIHHHWRFVRDRNRQSLKTTPLVSGFHVCCMLYPVNTGMTYFKKSKTTGLFYDGKKKKKKKHALMIFPSNDFGWCNSISKHWLSWGLRDPPKSLMDLTSLAAQQSSWLYHLSFYVFGVSNKQS